MLVVIIIDCYLCYIEGLPHYGGWHAPVLPTVSVDTWTYISQFPIVPIQMS